MTPTTDRSPSPENMQELIGSQLYHVYNISTQSTSIRYLRAFQWDQPRYIPAMYPTDRVPQNRIFLPETFYVLAMT
jgi:hypothetical protein